MLLIKTLSSRLELYLAWYNRLIEASHRLKTSHRHRSSSSFYPSLSESYRKISIATLSIAIACPSHPRNRAAYSISHSLPAPCMVLASLISIAEEYNKVDGKPDCSSFSMDEISQDPILKLIN